MRNRLGRRPSGEPRTLAVSEDDGSQEDSGLQVEKENEESQTGQSDSESVFSARAPLTRTTTREEIVQTDDELFSPPPVRRSWTQYRRIIFVLGCLMGLILAWTFQPPDLQLDALLDSVDMADLFDDIRAALPSALPMGLVKEAREIQENSRKSYKGTGAFSIGEQLSHEGLTANYPVVMVTSSVREKLTSTGA